MSIVGLTNLVVDFYFYDGKIFINGGGTVANILANLSSMGVSTCVYGYYANDRLGEFAKMQLEKVGVNTEFLEIENYKTKCFFIDKRGTSSICPYCGSHRKNHKTRKGIEKILSKDDIVLVQDLHNLGDIKNRIIWDFGYGKGILYMSKEDLSKLVYHKYFIVNLKKEVLDLILNKLKETFRGFIEKADMEFMIITDGKRGSTIIHGGRKYKFTPNVFEEIENNGCGDMYLATFISEVLKEDKNIDFEEINAIAQKNVKEVLMRIGARDYVTQNVEVKFGKKCICEEFSRTKD